MENNNLTPEIKKGLIRNLMFNLYADARTIYREYVQNALDSINAAVTCGILSQTKDGNVQINIDEFNRNVSIKDNGIGISMDSAVRRLLDISAQNKDGINQAGQFGIGRLVGGGYCSKLIFRTSAKGEEQATCVTFYIDKIWKMLNDAEDYLATEVIRQCTECKNYATPSEDHFFEVELRGIKEERNELLDKRSIEEYLNEVAPIDFKPEFKNGIVYNSLAKAPSFEGLFNQLDKVQIFLGEKKIQKQYGLKIEGTGDIINNLEFFKIETPDSEMLAWGWFALTKYTIQINRKKDNLAGIRLRKHNIQIGDSNLLSKYWKESRGNFYFYGEIHITHPKIEPNTARDGLAPSNETNTFYEKIEEYFLELYNLYTKANQVKKSIDRINEGIEELRKKGQDDHKTKNSIDARGDEVFRRCQESTTFGPAKRMLELYAEDHSKAMKEVKALRQRKNETKNISKDENDLSKQQTEGTSDVKVTDSRSNVTDVKEVSMEESSSNGVSTQDTNSNENENVQTSSTSTSISTKDTINVEALVTPLNINGKLDNSEIWIIKRALSVLYRNFPEEERDRIFVKRLMKLIVEEFNK